MSSELLKTGRWWTVSTRSSSRPCWFRAGTMKRLWPAWSRICGVSAMFAGTFSGIRVTCRMSRRKENASGWWRRSSTADKIYCMRSILLLFCLGRLAGAQPALPRYEVHRATSPITIDGKGDDKAWAAAGKIELIFPWEAQTGAKQKTIVRLLWDDTNLYVLYEC